jgi:hypothetical protein
MHKLFFDYVANEDEFEILILTGLFYLTWFSLDILLCVEGGEDWRRAVRTDNRVGWWWRGHVLVWTKQKKTLYPLPHITVRRAQCETVEVSIWEMDHQRRRAEHGTVTNRCQSFSCRKNHEV